MPSGEDVTVLVNPIAWLRAVTLALAITPPEVSFTVPEIVPEVT
ncbi:MAG: hypothetical protein WA299_07570 [Candidatus Acidiferrum sp.]